MKSFEHQVRILPIYRHIHTDTKTDYCNPMCLGFINTPLKIELPALCVFFETTDVAALFSLLMELSILEAWSVGAAWSVA